MAKLVERLRQLQRRAERAWSKGTRSAPIWLVVSGSLVIGALAGLPAGATREWTGALIGLLGVVLGGAIAGVTSFALERDRRRSQIALATWVERVRAHQEALSRWPRIRDTAHEEDAEKRKQTVSEAQNWWLNNCLYMSEDAREGFLIAYSAADNHQVFLNSLQKQDNEAVREILARNWERILSLPRILIECAGCHVTDQMLREIQRDSERQAKQT